MSLNNGETFRFSKEFRLLDSKDFSHMRSSSDSFRSRSFIIYFKHSRLEISHFRLGMSVSKKTGNAPRRNCIKRDLREFFRTSQLRPFAYDFFVVVSPKLKSLEKSELKSVLKADLMRFERFFLNRMAVAS